MLVETAHDWIGEADGRAREAGGQRGHGPVRLKDPADRAHILSTLRESVWNVGGTAISIDMPRSDLYKKIEKCGLVREDAGPSA